jgi:hypothetical protein
VDTFPDSMWDGDISQILGSLAPDGFWQKDRYYAHCPLHQDKDWSFCYEKRSRAWRCQSGCGSGDVVALGVRLWGCGIEAALAKMEALLGGQPRKIVRTYPYVDADGTLLFEVVRYEPKGFCARRPHKWLWALDNTPRVLYRLPEVIVAKEILIVEGEKDCETARSWGLVATSNAEGGGRWKAEYVQFFRQKRVQIISDADETGRWHARQVAGSLVPVADSVKLIELVGAKDLTEWAEQGGTPEKLADLFRGAPVLTLDDVAGWWEPGGSMRLTRGGEFLLEAKWVTVPTGQNGNK